MTQLRETLTLLDSKKVLSYAHYKRISKVDIRLSIILIFTGTTFYKVTKFEMSDD